MTTNLIEQHAAQLTLMENYLLQCSGYTAGQELPWPCLWPLYQGPLVEDGQPGMYAFSVN